MNMNFPGTRRLAQMGEAEFGQLVDSLSGVDLEELLSAYRAEPAESPTQTEYNAGLRQRAREAREIKAIPCRRC